MHIKKGDNVMVIAGGDRGKTGKILRVFPKKNQVLVEGINMKKKHQKATRTNQKGQVIEKSLPFHISNVMLVDGKTGKRTRVGHQMQGEKRVRVAKKSGSIIS